MAATPLSNPRALGQWYAGSTPAGKSSQRGPGSNVRARPLERRRSTATRPPADASTHVSTRVQATDNVLAADVTTAVQDAEDDVIVSFPETPLFVAYPHAKPAAQVLLSQHPSPADVATALAEFVARASEEAIRARGLFVIALSGGSLVQALAPLTSEPYRSAIDWSKWHILWVDERFGKHTSDHSNFKQAAGAFLSRVPVPEEQILPTDDEFSSIQEVAADYEALLQELVEDEILGTTKGVPFPRLDLILLGIGPEGHTASLFPNSPALATHNTRWVVPVCNSPKPPPERMTMTLPVINSARKVAFVATGSSKAEVVQRVLERPALPGSLPAQLVQPYAGTLTWFVDDSAAAQLSCERWNDPKSFPSVEYK